MKSRTLISIGLAVGGVVVAPARAAVIALFEFAFNVDGVITSGAFPPAASGAAFDTGIGLGSVQFTVGDAGSHYVGMFVDHEIDEALNTFFNEVGAVTGVPGPGQSWEIDEPGWASGDIFGNLGAGTLDSTVGVPTVFPEDVSMALAHDFVLGVGESAELTFTVGLVPPPGGLYLMHADPDSGAGLFFSSTLAIIPEPGPAGLAFGLAGLAVVLARRLRGRRG